MEIAVERVHCNCFFKIYLQRSVPIQPITGHVSDFATIFRTSARRHFTFDAAGSCGGPVLVDPEPREALLVPRAPRGVQRAT